MCIQKHSGSNLAPVRSQARSRKKERFAACQKPDKFDLSPPARHNGFPGKYEHYTLSIAVLATVATFRRASRNAARLQPLRGGWLSFLLQVGLRKGLYTDTLDLIWLKERGFIEAFASKEMTLDERYGQSIFLDIQECLSSFISSPSALRASTCQNTIASSSCRSCRLATETSDAIPPSQLTNISPFRTLSTLNTHSTSRVTRRLKFKRYTSTIN